MRDIATPTTSRLASLPSNMRLTQLPVAATTWPVTMGLSGDGVKWQQIFETPLVTMIAPGRVGRADGGT